MRFTTIFHFLNFEQSISRCLLIKMYKLDIVAQIKFTILSCEKGLDINQIKKILVNIIKCQMSFKFTFTKLFCLYEVYCY